MKVVLVSKGGGVFYTRDAAKKASQVGEQGETEGLLRYLASPTWSDEIRVIYHGQWRGDEIPGVTIHSPSVKGMSEWTTGAEQREQLDRDHARLTETIRQVDGDEVLCHINVCGYAPTFSHVDNPNDATVQAAAILYSAPMLDTMQRMKLRRVLVNNDPRTYPRDQEMSKGWPHCRPVALLDQCDREYPTVVGGAKYLRKSVWARAESWAYHIRGENTDELPVVCVAHCHIADGCRESGRDVSFLRILGDREHDGAGGWCLDDSLVRLGLRVYGRGWEHFSGYEGNAQVFPGPIRPNEVTDVLRRGTCCPAVSAGRGFYTGKVYVCQAQGCIPLLYGDGGDPYTWDPYEIFEPFSSPWRVRYAGDLSRIVTTLRTSPSARAERRATWEALCRPNFDKLDRLLEDLITGDCTPESSPDQWHARYGGFIPL